MEDTFTSEEVREMITGESERKEGKEEEFHYIHYIHHRTMFTSEGRDGVRADSCKPHPLTVGDSVTEAGRRVSSHNVY